jgi:hypothetical protein
MNYIPTQMMDGYHKLNILPGWQSTVITGSNTTSCRVGLSYLLVIISNLYSDWLEFPFIEMLVELRRLELLTPCLQTISIVFQVRSG